MKIAIVGLLHHPIAEPFAGGMESHTWWLAKKLIERGHEVSLFASGDSDSNLGLVPCLSTAFATHPQGQTAAGRYACNMAAYTDVIQQLSQSNFDIVHNNALYPFLLSSAADLPAPMLTVLHSPPYEELVTAIRYATARDKLNRLSIVAVSKSLATEWKAITPTAVIYNGIDIDRWPFVPQTPPNRALWYGRMVPEKGPHLAIKAALKAGYEIQIAGPISNREYFKESVAPLLKGDRVHYLGHLSHSEIRQALSKASVFVNTPRWEEPYGIVYAEALASGTPVAAFDRGAAREILTERCGIAVKAENVDQLAQAISAAAKLSRQDCRQRAESFCDINQMIDGYEHQYQQLILRQQGMRSPLQIPEVAA